MTHRKAFKRLLRYLFYTKDLGICFKCVSQMQTPVVYIDTDWTGDREMGRCMSGCVVMMSGATVFWYARLQKIVALSCTETEYISLCSIIKEVVWICRLLHDPAVVAKSSHATTVLIYNKGEIKLALNSSVMLRTKHTDVRFHYTRQAQQDEAGRLEFCPAERMVANTMTKAVDRVYLGRLAEDTGLHNC